jgi:hypothetical protein
MNLSMSNGNTAQFVATHTSLGTGDRAVGKARSSPADRRGRLAHHLLKKEHFRTAGSVLISDLVRSIFDVV